MNAAISVVLRRAPGEAFGRRSGDVQVAMLAEHGGEKHIRDVYHVAPIQRFYSAGHSVVKGKF